MATGCVFAMLSALLTSLMLFINGSLVMAILSALQQAGPGWASNPQLSQFLLFTLPVVFAIIQWMMIDYVRTRLRARAS